MSKLKQLMSDVQGKGTIAEVSGLYKLCDEYEKEISKLKKDVYYWKISFNKQVQTSIR